MQSSPGITIIEEDPEPKEVKELPSLKNTILNPRNLIVGLAISVVLNIVLLFTAIYASSNDSTTPTPTTRPTSAPTSIVTTRPTVGPTQTPDESSNSLKNCFQNCSTDELITQVKTQAEKVNDFKSLSSVVKTSSKNCYNDYLQATELNEYHTYSTFECDKGYLSVLPQDNIHVGDNLYVLNESGNWNVETQTRIGENKLMVVVNDLQKQTDKEVSAYEPGEQFRTITGTSQVINDLNQEVETTIVLTINEYLQVVRYEITTENGSTEYGNFFELGIPNNIEAPF